MKIKLLKIISVLLLICSIMSFSAVGTGAYSDIFNSVIPNASYMGNKYDSFTPGREILKNLDNGKALAYNYDKLLEGIKKYEETIDILSLLDTSMGITSDEMTLVYNAVINDHPEIFWVNGITFGLYKGKIYNVSPNYTGTPNEISEDIKALDKKADEVLKGLVNRKGRPIIPDYDFSLEVHDRLCKMLEYGRSDNDQTVYGALVEGRALCAGYSRAYQYLMERSGINAWTVTGDSVSPLTYAFEPHAWNLVRLDDTWVYTDVTWDDCCADDSIIVHNYFNCTDSQLSATHIAEDWIAPYLPKCDSLKYNTFNKNNTVVSSFNVEETVKMLWAGRGVLDIYYTGGNVQDYLNAFQANISQILQKLGATEITSMEGIVTDKELILNVTSNLPFDKTLSGKIKTNINPDKAAILTLKRDGYLVEKKISLDSDETLCFDKLLPGEYTLTVQKKGYIEATKNVSVSDADNFRVEMRAFGDISGDDAINTTDTNFAKRIMAGTFNYSECAELEMAASDVNNDGAQNAMDLFLMKGYIVGKISEF